MKVKRKSKKKKSASSGLAPRQIGVKMVATNQLFQNPHNPRVLFDKDPLDILRTSIEKVGILVPLTVYFDSRKKRTVILDGQRRWMCAKDLNLPEVPVNEVAEPTLVQNIVTMFQIHKLREDWELMPTALKLELLMEEMKERSNRNLAALTGLDQAVVQRCKKLLDYPKKYQDMMLDGDPTKRVKADFFIELYVVRNDRFVISFDWYTKDRFTKAMLQRYQAGRLRSVTDFRLIKQHINNARNAGKEAQICRKLEQFTESDDLTIEHLQIGTATALAEARAIQTRIGKLVDELRKLDVESCVGEEKLWKALESLLTLIRKKLRDAGRRPTQ
ncbi:MAG: ParB N-terminal domain-containing protein [Planctomycetes bacterium]|nr:ParB N-terminal domain-containing protein [Planctomycetota bacterium]